MKLKRGKSPDSIHLPIIVQNSWFIALIVTYIFRAYEACMELRDKPVTYEDYYTLGLSLQDFTLRGISL
jgi:hypothetical protein